MLAGLIFATDDATDRPDTLAATLPFGGSTLIEFQARLLLTAGAGQIVVVVSRLTPPLLGAVSRMQRRGISIDIVRSATEAEAKLHPLAHVLVMADGLVSTDAIVAQLAEDGDDLLLVTSDAEALPGLERVGADAIWAGMARVEVQRIAEVAALPKEYDFQSTLLRVVAQASPGQLLLTRAMAATGHGVERDAARLAERNQKVLASFVSNQPGWVDRYLVAPVARRVLPMLTARATPALAVSGGALVSLIAGLGMIGWGWTAIGLPFVIAATGGFAIGAVLSWMRDESAQAKLQRAGIAVAAGLSILLVGNAISRAEGTATGITVALALIVAAALAERATTERIRRRWWASPAAYPLILLPFSLIGYPLAGLCAGALYASVSLAAAIEVLREKP